MIASVTIIDCTDQSISFSVILLSHTKNPGKNRRPQGERINDEISKATFYLVSTVLYQLYFYTKHNSSESLIPKSDKRQKIAKMPKAKPI